MNDVKPAIGGESSHPPLLWEEHAKVCGGTGVEGDRQGVSKARCRTKPPTRLSRINSRGGKEREVIGINEQIQK